MGREEFSKAVKRQIHKNYNHRCAVCLKREPVVGERGWDCAHIIAAAGQGEEQVGNVETNLRPPGHSRSAVENGILRTFVILTRNCPIRNE